MNDANEGEAGQAIIEFAVISIPLFLLLLIMIDAGMFFYGHINAAQAVREGARCAVVGGDSDDVISTVEEGFPGNSPTVTVSDRSSIQVGDDITVSATWSYNWVGPMAAFGLSPSITKDYSVTMRAEGPEIAGRNCG